MVTHSEGREGNVKSMQQSAPSKPAVSENHVITVAAGYSVEQIRLFLASLQHFAPGVSLDLIVDRVTPEYEKAVRGLFPRCSFHLLPPSALRDFGLKRKWARSILKRLTEWSGSRELGVRLLKVNILRYLVVCDLLSSWNLANANILLSDSRDVVFQADPFLGKWPLLWTCKEDKRIEDCGFNRRAFIQAGGEAAFLKARHNWVVCSGITGGRSDHVLRYLQIFSQMVRESATRFALRVGDQGIHNYLVWLRPELEFTILPNGSIAANLALTDPKNLIFENDLVRLRDNPDTPGILHQYDRHPQLNTLVEKRWGTQTL
jgi:hypothetical protein